MTAVPCVEWPTGQKWPTNLLVRFRQARLQDHGCLSRDFGRYEVTQVGARHTRFHVHGDAQSLRGLRAFDSVHNAPLHRCSTATESGKTCNQDTIHCRHFRHRAQTDVESTTLYTGPIEAIRNWLSGDYISCLGSYSLILLRLAMHPCTILRLKSTGVDYSRVSQTKNKK